MSEIADFLFVSTSRYLEYSMPSTNKKHLIATRFSHGRIWDLKSCFTPAKPQPSLVYASLREYVIDPLSDDLLLIEAVELYMKSEIFV